MSSRWDCKCSVDYLQQQTYRPSYSFQMKFITAPLPLLPQHWKHILSISVPIFPAYFLSSIDHLCLTICNKRRSVMILLPQLGGGEGEINWCSGIIWAALYHHHPGEINPNITRYKVNPALGSYNVVRGPFMNICLIIQACLPDTRVVKGVVTWSSPWWMN